MSGSDLTSWYSTLPMTQVNGLVWLPARYDDGRPGAVAVGTERYDTVVDTMITEGLSAPDGHVGPVAVAEGIDVETVGEWRAVGRKALSGHIPESRVVKSLPVTVLPHDDEVSAGIHAYIGIEVPAPPPFDSEVGPERLRSLGSAQACRQDGPDPDRENDPCRRFQHQRLSSGSVTALR